MKKIVILILISASYICQAQITFQKTYSGGYGYNISQTNDGGYFIIGSLYPQQPGNTIDINLIKTDGNGDTTWTRTIGMSDHDNAYSGQQTADGGYIILGNIETPFSSILIRLNSFGDTIWTKRYKAFSGKVVQQTSDGGFIVAGSILLASSQAEDAYLLKTDSLGEVLWKKSYGYSNKDDIAECLTLTTDSGIIFAGITEGISAATRNIWVIKTNDTGDTIWTKEMGDFGIDQPSDILQTYDGNFLLAGYSENGGTNVKSLFILQIDANGDTLWSRTYDNGDYPGTSVQQTADSGFIISGSTQPIPNQGADLILIKTNSAGDTLWSKAFGGSLYDHSYSVQIISDGYLISGNTQSFATIGTNTYLIKTDLEGISGCNEYSFNTVPGILSFSFLKDTLIVTSQIDTATAIYPTVGFGGTATALCMAVNINDEINNTSSLNIFPNPASGTINISLNSSISDINIKKVEIFNLIGETVFEKPFEFNSQSSTEMMLDISSLKCGFYVLCLNGDRKFRSRIVVQ